MSLAFIGLGSNLGDGAANILEAWQRLGQDRQITGLSISSPFRSAPLGMDSAQWFTNAVAVAETRLQPEALLELMLSIETDMGRDRSQGMDRTIDLDILYYDDLVISSERLDLPHPEIRNRMFVLAPMEELAPDHLHPVYQQSTTTMRRGSACQAGQAIEKTTWPETA